MFAKTVFRATKGLCLWLPLIPQLLLLPPQRLQFLGLRNTCPIYKLKNSPFLNALKDRHDATTKQPSSNLQTEKPIQLLLNKTHWKLLMKLFL